MAASIAMRLHAKHGGITIPVMGSGWVSDQIMTT
jgi:hypothetical protein